jgi:hypothetical protein
LQIKKVAHVAAFFICLINGARAKPGIPLASFADKEVVFVKAFFGDYLIFA